MWHRTVSVGTHRETRGTAHKAVCVKSLCIAGRLPRAAKQEYLKERGNRTMKKSFLKRVAAAVVAVPVALTQTALFTSFAAGETTDTNATATKALTVDSLMAIDAGSALIPKADFKSGAGTRFTVPELGNENAYVQVSTWNNKVSADLNSRDGKTYALDKVQLADAIAREGAMYDMVRNALMDKASTAEAKVDGGVVTVTVKFDYAYSEDLAQIMQEEMNKKIATKYDDITVTVEQDALKKLGNLNGTITLTADMSNLADKTADFSAAVEIGGKKLEGVEAVKKFAVELMNDAVDAMKADAASAVDSVVGEKKALVAEKKALLDEKEVELNEKEAELNAKEAELAEKKAELDDLIAEGASNSEINDAKAKVIDAQKKANDARVKVADARNQIADANAQIKDANEQLQHARDLVEEELENYAENLRTKFNKRLAQFDEYSAKSIDESTSVPQADVNAALAAVDKKHPKSPASIEKVESNRWYKRATKLFDNAVKQINNQTEGAQIAITSSDVMNVVKGATDVNMAVKADGATYTANGETLFYVADTDFDAETVKAEINKMLEADNEEVDGTVYSVKVVEAKGNATAATKFEGSATLDIYRVVWFDTKEKTTEEPSTEEPSTEEPSTEAPTTEEPSTEAPTTEEPTTEAPSTGDTTTENPTTDTTTSDSKVTDGTTTTSDTDDTTTTTTTSDTNATTTTTTTSDTDATTTTTTTSDTNVTTTTSDTTATTETTKHTAVAGEIEMNVVVKADPEAGAGFYFSHDERPFDSDALLEEIPEESPEMEGKVDPSKFTFGVVEDDKAVDKGADFAPSALYDANCEEDAYVVKELYVFYDGLKVVDADRNAVKTVVYIGVKGDLNQDGICNANDATAALKHATQVATTKEGEPLPTITDMGRVVLPAAVTDDLKGNFDKFLCFLADVNTEKSVETPAEGFAVNAIDATNMLKYAALIGTGYEPGAETWAKVLGDKLPPYSALLVGKNA